MTWEFQDHRTVFPWALLRLSRVEGGAGTIITKGLCGLEVSAGSHTEDWQVATVNGLAEGSYTADLIFLDNSQRTWLLGMEHGDSQPPILSRPIPLGLIQIVTTKDR
jgi:hypothetical protein